MFGQQLAHPYFKRLAKVDRKPSCRAISKMEFEFERARVKLEDIRGLIFQPKTSSGAHGPSTSISPSFVLLSGVFFHRKSNRDMQRKGILRETHLVNSTSGKTAASKLWLSVNIDTKQYFMTGVGAGKLKSSDDRFATNANLLKEKVATFGGNGCFCCCSQEGGSCTVWYDENVQASSWRLALFMETLVMIWIRKVPGISLHQPYVDSFLKWHK